MTDGVCAGSFACFLGAFFSVVPHLPSLQIHAVQSVVPNKSNHEIVLVLQQFDNNLDKAVQAFMDGK